MMDIKAVCPVVEGKVNVPAATEARLINFRSCKTNTGKRLPDVRQPEFIVVLTINIDIEHGKMRIICPAAAPEIRLSARYGVHYLLVSQCKMTAKCRPVRAAFRFDNGPLAIWI